MSKKILKGLIIADAFREFKINKKICINNIKGGGNEDYYNLNNDFLNIEYTQLIYENTSLIPDLDIKSTYDFGDYNFIELEELTEQDHGYKQVLVRGLITDSVNKDKLLRNSLDNHIHKFQKHMYYLNLNDGTGNIAVQINPWTYEKYVELLDNINQKPVIVLGTCTSDAKKIICDMIQIVDQTTDIDDYFNEKENCKGMKTIITSAIPMVSKNGKSYYRLSFSNNQNGLCFQLSEKLYPGMKVIAYCTKPPFYTVQPIYKT